MKREVPRSDRSPTAIARCRSAFDQEARWRVAGVAFTCVIVGCVSAYVVVTGNWPPILVGAATGAVVVAASRL